MNAVGLRSRHISPRKTKAAQATLHFLAHETHLAAHASRAQIARTYDMVAVVRLALGHLTASRNDEGLYRCFRWRSIAEGVHDRFGWRRNFGTNIAACNGVHAINDQAPTIQSRDI